MAELTIRVRTPAQMMRVQMKSGSSVADLRAQVCTEFAFRERRKAFLTFSCCGFADCNADDLRARETEAELEARCECYAKQL